MSTEATQDTAIENLLHGFRVSEHNAPEAVANGFGHPVLIASNKFVEAEQNLSIARTRLEAAEKELDDAKKEVEHTSDLFEQQKAKLAELLK